MPRCMGMPAIARTWADTESMELYEAPVGRSSEKEYGRKANILLAAGCAALVISILAYFAWLHSLDLSKSSSDWGTFGDFVGGIAGTAISLVTLWAIASTLKLQAKELAETKQQLQDQALTMERENIEATFFRLLANRRENVASFAVNGLSGRRAIHYCATQLAERVQNFNRNPPVIGGAASLVTTVDLFLSENRDLDPVIGSTAQLLKYALVHESENNRLSLLTLAHADLALADNVLFLYVGVSRYGERFDLFETFRDAKLFRAIKENEFVVAIDPKVLMKYQ